MGMDETQKKNVKEIFDTLTESQQKMVCALVGLSLGYNESDNDEYIEHHGVKGMKWGVRRYQNYDGSYTRKGLERYKKAESNYEKAKEAQKKGVGSRSEVRVAKKKMSNAYDKLKSDKMADEGKKLYSKGKTITGNATKTMFTEAAIAAGANAAFAILDQLGDRRLASISSAVIATGGTAINAMLTAKNNSDNKKLRAYYSH